MAGGYLGKILWVNLSNAELKEETPDESLYKDFIGGYGIGVRLLYSRQKSGVDPLGPDNIFGLLTGPLTGTPVPSGCRYTAVAKSPLTGGWGDANAGGDFAPHLKFGGYDAVFFTGISEKPVYLLLDNGKAQLKDASALWGKDSYETEDTLKAEFGDKSELVCIGQSGEKLSLISCIVGNRGAAAARSGLGAVMGAKKLKAVVARGEKQVPLANRDLVMQIRKEHIDEINRPGPDGVVYRENFHKYGTSRMTVRSAHSGDSPVKNWGGVGIVDFPDVSPLHMDKAIANLEKHAGCWQCPIGCEGRLKAGKGEYEYPLGTRRPEYETYSSFGSLCLNNNLESINMANHICNSYGLDTISAGGVIAFAIECYEEGLITKRDTGGIELTWGNHRAMIDMTWKLAKREGFGDVLADGVKAAAERIGKGAEKFAIHAGGQEIGMHDPKLVGAMGPSRPSGARYQLEPTPGRHMLGFGPSGFPTHIINCSGVCLIAGYRGGERVAKFINAVTGWERPFDEMMKAGERILNLRHAFNLREGINPLQDWQLPARVLGEPPQSQGPLSGARVDIEAQNYWNLGALDWDRVTTKPSKAKLLSLGLKDVADDLWPPAPPGPRP